MTPPAPISTRCTNLHYSGPKNHGLLNYVPLFQLPPPLVGHRAYRNTTTRSQSDQSKESHSIYLLSTAIVESRTRDG